MMKRARYFSKVVQGIISSEILFCLEDMFSNMSDALIDNAMGNANMKNMAHPKAAPSFGEPNMALLSP